MIEIEFSWPEVWIASVAGVMRQIQNMKRKAKQRHGATDDTNWQRHILACHGEMALAKHMNKFWYGAIGDYDAADVGKLHQVRATDHAAGRLLLHPDDDDAAPFVLARVNNRKITLVGWMFAREGKLQDFWEAPKAHPHRPAFFVPNNLLHDMADMPR